MPTPLDLALIGLIAVLWTVYEHFVAWPRFMKRLAAGDPRARVRTYLGTIAKEWILSLGLVVAWNAQRHPWSALPLAAPSPSHLAIGAAICLGITLIMALQIRAIMRMPDPGRLRDRLKSVAPILPHTRGELGWFFALSITAGICEEWMFRGVLTALLTALVGLPVAIVLCNVAFGFAHSYQGPRGIVKTGVGGLVMSGIVLVSGWIVPAMIVHAVVDIGSGLTTYLVLSGDDGKSAQAA